MARAFVLAAAIVSSSLQGGALMAQHVVDMWVGQDSNGRLTLAGVDRSTPIPLSPVAGVVTGWSGINPGFDHIVDPDARQDIYPLSAGADVWMRVESMSPALELIDEDFHSHDHLSAVRDHHLGDEHLHVHFTWLIDSTAPSFDPLQTAWRFRFTLVDASDLHAASRAESLIFQNVECEAGDVDGDGSLTAGDVDGFRRVLSDPAAASHRERAASDADYDGFVTLADECPFLALHGLAGFIRGDANADAAVDLSDGVFILAYLFTGGAAPKTAAAADVDANGLLEISDPIYLLAHLFLGGDEPPAPFPRAGCAE